MSYHLETPTEFSAAPPPLPMFELIEAAPPKADPAKLEVLRRQLPKVLATSPAIRRKVYRVARVMILIGCVRPGGFSHAVDVDEQLRRLVEEPSWSHPADLLGPDHAPLREIILLCRMRLFDGDGDRRALSATWEKLRQVAAAEKVRAGGDVLHHGPTVRQTERQMSLRTARRLLGRL